MTEVGFLVGPLGSLQPLDGVQVTTVAATRQYSEMTLLDGSRMVSQSENAPREWSIPLARWSSPTLVKWAAAAAQGLLGDVWLHDVAGARANMLPPSATAGRTGTRILVDGAVPLCPLVAGFTVQVPVRSGYRYRLSGTTTAASGSTLGSATGAGISAALTAPAGTTGQPRAFTTTLIATSTGTLLITVSSAVVTGLRLAESVITGASLFADAGGWLPGAGSPCRVAVVDPAQTLQLLLSGLALSDYDLTLREVGIPGKVT